MEQEDISLDTMLRSSAEEILNEHNLIASQKFFRGLFGTISGIGAIINRNRQIVYVNDDFLKILGLDSIESVLGKRPGEIVSCIHAANNTGGCGTAPSCSFCGAHNAIVESQRTGEKATREAFITTKENGKLKSIDLNIISTPVNLSGHTFYALMLQDISSEKRRLALEKIFFHDLLNSAGGLNGLLSLLKERTAPKVERQLIDLSEAASRELIEEIQLQRQIYKAEIGDLQIDIEKVNSIKIINAVIGKIGFHESGRDKKLSLSGDAYDADFETDNILLQRVLINLVKNALEATPENGTVILGAENLHKMIRFWVKNEGVIPRDVQLQLFLRSFTTKGIGRGLGTYSIKLLTENYLEGHVSFISNEAEGTIFRVDLNKVFTDEI